MNYAPGIVGHNRKIDPSRRPVTKGPLLPDGSLNDNDRVEIGPTDLAFAEWAELGISAPNLAELRAYRLSRLVGELHRNDYAAVLMFDPINIRYASDTTNMQLWATHNPCRACLVLANGHMVLWDFHGGDHLSAHLPLVKEVRHGASFFYFEVGPRGIEVATRFAAEVTDILQTHCGNNRRLAIDKIELSGSEALRAAGLQLFEGQAVTELARHIKDHNELNAMRCSLAACEAAMWDMHSMAKPGLSEVAIWAELQKGNHIRGGEWIETRILSSGPRTNPWFQEAGPRTIMPGDILAFDTDLIGPYGYCSDLSRTWKIGGSAPDAEEQALFNRACDQIDFNTNLLKPGLSFRELMELSDQLDDELVPQYYGVLYHGVGLADEYPSIRYSVDWDDCGYDGVLEIGQCLCVESYVGCVGGPFGIKLENQVVITETGYENLTKFPMRELFWIPV